MRGEPQVAGSLGEKFAKKFEELQVGGSQGHFQAYFHT